jgi:hypothetical protein
MPDDPNKRGPRDRARVSQQKHEQSYRRRGAKGNRTKARKPS